MLTNLFSNTASTISMEALLISCLVSIILGFFIALTHKFTSNYSKSYLTTIAVLPFLVQVVIMLVNGNLGTGVAIMGAFSLVRFRSLPGNAKEILTVFFAMVVGLAIGTGYLVFSTIMTVVGCIILIIYNKINIFEKNNNEKLLSITIPEDLDYTDVFNDEFNKYTSSNQLIKVKTTNMGSMFDLKYKITLKDISREKEFIDSLRIKNGNLKIMISHPLEDSEL